MKVFVGIDAKQDIILVQFHDDRGQFDSREWQYRTVGAAEAWKKANRLYGQILEPVDAERPEKYLGHSLSEFKCGRLRSSESHLSNVSSSMVKEL